LAAGGRRVSAGAADFVREAEMGFSHAELLSSLPSAVAPYRIDKRSERVYHLHHAAEPGRRVELTLQPETRRTLAAITVPVTKVKLEFFNFSADDFEDFMRRYKRYLHKGGG